MDIIIDIVNWLIFQPFFAFWQAVFGILYPTTDPNIIRAKRATAILLVLGTCTICVAFILGYLGIGFWKCLLIFVGGLLLLSIAGGIGGYVEKRAKEAASEDDT